MGRDYYEHGAQPGQGYRNGYGLGRLKTAKERWSIRRRRSRGGMSRSARLFASISRVIRRDWRIWRSRCWRVGYRYAISKMPSKTRMVACCYRKPRRVAAWGAIWGGLPAFAQRDLSEYEITYLFVDGIAERLRPGAKREPVLAAWGFTMEGRRVLLHMMAGSKEDAETVTAFFEDMKRRGLKDPLLVTLGRCSGHHQGDRNLLSTRGPPAVPCASHAELGGQTAGGCLAGVQGSRAGGLSSAKPSHCARARGRGRCRLWPQVRHCGCLLHGQLRRPASRACNSGHHPPRDRRICLSVCSSEDAVASSIPNAFGERAVLKLMFGALIRAAERWRSVKVTEFELAS